MCSISIVTLVPSLLITGEQMRASRLVVPLAVLVAFVGCGSETNTVMPNVTGKKLDVATGAIKDAGVDDEAEVDGGGVFGIVEESNWEVCEQSPGAGQTVSGTPRLKVERSCDRTSTSTAAATTDDVAPAPEKPQSESVLTPRTNADLAAVLKVSDSCEDEVATFADEYGGRTIRFNGSVVNLMNSAGYDTRYDVLIAPGSKGPSSTVGPAMKFEDVGISDLELKGSDVPDAIGEGDRFQFTAEVGEFRPGGCLLMLDPVSTEVG